MHEEYALLVFLSVGLAAALVFGLITERLRLSPIVGYLLAGVLVGPNTPGIVADPHMAVQLAEIGVVLLMFGVGLHFNLKDLWAVRKIALPGAVGQILAATLLCTLSARWHHHRCGPRWDRDTVRTSSSVLTGPTDHTWSGASCWA